MQDKLHMLQEGALGALRGPYYWLPGHRNFLLTTFREAVSLWHRLRLTQAAAPLCCTSFALDHILL